MDSDVKLEIATGYHVSPVDGADVTALLFRLPDGNVTGVGLAQQDIGGLTAHLLESAGHQVRHTKSDRRSAPVKVEGLDFTPGPSESEGRLILKFGATGLELAVDGADLARVCRSVLAWRITCAERSGSRAAMSLGIDQPRPRVTPPLKSRSGSSND